MILSGGKLIVYQRAEEKSCGLAVQFGHTLAHTHLPLGFGP